MNSANGKVVAYVPATMHEPLVLQGTWSVTPATDELRRQFASAAYEDGHWNSATVPGYIGGPAGDRAGDPAIDPGGDPAIGPDVDSVLVRRTFTYEWPAAPHRVWLRFPGAFPTAEIWWNDHYLGDSESPWDAATFELIPDPHAPPPSSSTPQVVAAELMAEPVSGEGRRRTFVTTAAGLDGSEERPGPVRRYGLTTAPMITTTGPVAIGRLRTDCVTASTERAVLRVELQLDSATATTAEVTATLGEKRVTSAHVLASGVNQVETELVVDRPTLWWPAGMGGQALTDLRVVVSVGGTESDSAQRKVALRQVRRVSGGGYEVNSVPTPVRGAAVPSGLLPLGHALAPAESADLLRPMRRLLDAGFNTVRPLQHVMPIEAYQFADQLGLMVVQDLPFAGAADRRAKASASRLAVSISNFVADHGAVIDIWCHEDPSGRTGRSRTPRTVRRSVSNIWHQIVFGRAVAEAVKRGDAAHPIVDRTVRVPLNLFGPTRPSNIFLRTSGHPRLAEPDGRRPRSAGLTARITSDVIARNWPRATRFLAGVDPSDPLVSKRIIEWNRSIPPREAAGFFVKVDLGLVDPSSHPDGPLAADWRTSVRSPLPVAEVPLAPIRSTAGFAIPIRVVAEPSTPRIDSEATQSNGGRLDVRLGWGHGAYSDHPEHVHSWRFVGEIDPTGVTYVGTIQVGPLLKTGPVRLRLELEIYGELVANEYRFEIGDRKRS